MFPPSNRIPYLLDVHDPPVISIVTVVLAYTHALLVFVLLITTLLISIFFTVILFIKRRSFDQFYSTIFSFLFLLRSKNKS